VKLNELYSELNNDIITKECNELLDEISDDFKNIRSLIMKIINKDFPQDKLLEKDKKKINEASHDYIIITAEIEAAIKTVKDRINRLNDLIPNIEKDVYLDFDTAHRVTLKINMETVSIKNIIRNIDSFTHLTKIERKSIKIFCKEYGVCLNGLNNIIKNYNIINRTHSVDVPDDF
jgi:hypothetical protein